MPLNNFFFFLKVALIKHLCSILNLKMIQMVVSKILHCRCKHCCFLPDIAVNPLQGCQPYRLHWNVPIPWRQTLCQHRDMSESQPRHSLRAKMRGAARGWRFRVGVSGRRQGGDVSTSAMEFTPNFIGTSETQNKTKLKTKKGIW